jgi:hypothetical protein
MKAEKQQTAVEWFAEQATQLEIKKAKGNISVYQMINELSNVLNQAKEMEKEQISIAYKEGWNCPHGEGFPETGEQYYKETFKQQEQ